MLTVNAIDILILIMVVFLVGALSGVILMDKICRDASRAARKIEQKDSVCYLTMRHCHCPETDCEDCDAWKSRMSPGGQQ